MLYGSVHAGKVTFYDVPETHGYVYWSPCILGKSRYYPSILIEIRDIAFLHHEYHFMIFNSEKWIRIRQILFTQESGSLCILCIELWKTFNNYSSNFVLILNCYTTRYISYLQWKIWLLWQNNAILIRNNILQKYKA